MKWADTWLLLVMAAVTITLGDVVSGQSPVEAVGAALAAIGMFLVEEG